MLWLRASLTVGVLLLRPAGDPDFYVAFSECKTTIGYLVDQREQMRVIDGMPYMLAYSRTSAQLECDLRFKDGEEGHKGSTVRYFIDVDAPPLLAFTDENRGDYIMIDVVHHNAVGITRVLTEASVASKVCTGVYGTAMELREMQKQRN